MNLQSDSYTYKEIMSQANVWEATLAYLQSYQGEICSWLKEPREIVYFTGCGSTYYLSLHAAAVWQALTGTIARGIPASELWLAPELYLTRAPSLLVTVSRSAITTETLRALKVYMKLAGDNSVAITCYSDRELTKATTHALVAADAAEQSVVQTRSFTSMTIMAHFLAGIAANRLDILEELASLPEITRQLIPNYEHVLERVGCNLGFEHFIFLGSGANYGIACEGMLKLKEMTLSNSEAFHFLEFRHGPKSILNSKVVVIGLLSDTMRQEEVAVLAEIQKLGAYVIAITESGDDLPANEIIALRSGVGELSRGIIALPLMQLFAYYRALEKGLDPDHPLNLTSVVDLK